MPKKTNDKTLLTREGKDKNYGSPGPSIVRASTILYRSVPKLHEALKNVENPDRKNNHYGRVGTQTNLELQRILSKLEQCDHIHLCPSGLAAVTLVIMSVCKSEDEILMSDSAYEPSKYVARYLEAFGIKCRFFDPRNIQTIENLISPQTKLIYCESPGSYTFEFHDLSKIIHIAKKNKILTAIDNTWATALNFKPIPFGFDFSIVAATKYYSGHSDFMMGTVAHNQKHITEVMNSYRYLGYHVNAEDAYLCVRGLRTLSVRMQEHQKNTKLITKLLLGDKKVINVFSPYNKKISSNKFFKKYFLEGSGLLGFTIQSIHQKKLQSAMAKLKVFAIGYSWGAFESMILPSYIDQRQFNYISKNETLLRIHVGLEDIKDIIEDLNSFIDSL